LLSELAVWKKHLEEDIRTLKLRNNRALLRIAALKKRISVDVESALLVELLQAEILANPEHCLSLAVGHAAQRTVVIEGDFLKLPVESLHHALHVLREQEVDLDGPLPLSSSLSLNEFEKKLVSDVVAAGDLNVTFDEIGSFNSCFFSCLSFFAQVLWTR
jgi:hypothetical protein